MILGSENVQNIMKNIWHLESGNQNRSETHLNDEYTRFIWEQRSLKTLI